MERRFGIFYFSGTGNTWWTAREIGRGLKALGWAGEMYSLETLEPGEAGDLMEELDLVLLGYPVYASDLPRPVWEFIENLPDKEFAVQPLGVFCTQLLFSGDGAILPRRALKRKGFRQGWAVHFLMPNNICVAQWPFRFEADYEIHRPRLRKTARRIGRFCRRLDSGRPWLQGRNPLMKANAWLQRGPYRHYFPGWRNDVSVDPLACTLCGRCVKNCPVGNIVLAEETLQFRGRCVLCLRCYNFCPTQAVLYRGRAHPAKRGLPFQGPVAEFRPELLKERTEEES